MPCLHTKVWRQFIGLDYGCNKTFKREDIEISGSLGIHHNVDAPFGKPDPNPKVTRQIHEGDPYDRKLTSTMNKTHEDHDDQENDFTGYAKDTGKSAVETAFDVGKTVAEGMEKTFSGVKETTEKVKDTVIGNNDEGEPLNDLGNDNVNQGNVDKHVQDLRRKAAGYDRHRRTY